MNSDEEQIIQAFFEEGRRKRFIAQLGGNRRAEALDRLNHLGDLDRRWVSPVGSPSPVLQMLRDRGAPTSCHVISDNDEIDGRGMKLEDAILQAEKGPWGTIIGCIPGQLGFYWGEDGPKGRERLLLERTLT